LLGVISSIICIIMLNTFWMLYWYIDIIGKKRYNN
jgi:hypothetical protein